MAETVSTAYAADGLAITFVSMSELRRVQQVGWGMWSVAGTAVDRLAEKVHVAEVAGVLLDEVGEDPT